MTWVLKHKAQQISDVNARNSYWSSLVLSELKICQELPDDICIVFGFFTNTQDWQYWHCCQFHIPRICSFLLYLHHMILVNVQLNVSGYKGIKYCQIRWSASFLMALSKWSWQYWHSSIVDSLWKPLLPVFPIAIATNILMADSVANPGFLRHGTLIFWKFVWK